MKYSDDGKKLLIDEKGPAKKKTAKTLAEKSSLIIINYLSEQFFDFKLIIKDKHWDELAAKLPDNVIKYIAIQVDYKDSKGAVKNDILIISW